MFKLIRENLILPTIVIVVGGLLVYCVTNAKDDEKTEKLYIKNHLYELSTKIDSINNRFTEINNIIIDLEKERVKNKGKKFLYFLNFGSSREDGLIEKINEINLQDELSELDKFLHFMRNHTGKVYSDRKITTVINCYQKFYEAFEKYRNEINKKDFDPLTDNLNMEVYKSDMNINNTTKTIDIGCRKVSVIMLSGLEKAMR